MPLALAKISHEGRQLGKASCSMMLHPHGPALLWQWLAVLHPLNDALDALLDPPCRL